MNLVSMYGVLLNVSNVIMGLTFLAWGNSIGDVVADYTLAKQGHPRMSLSACFAGPLFSKSTYFLSRFLVRKESGSFVLHLSLCYFDHNCKFTTKDRVRRPPNVPMDRLLSRNIRNAE